MNNGDCLKKQPGFTQAVLLSLFPPLALTRSGGMGIFSESVFETPQKREHK